MCGRRARDKDPSEKVRYSQVYGEERGRGCGWVGIGWTIRFDASAMGGKEERYMTREVT